MTNLLHRPRRLRGNATLRSMIRETRVHGDDLIYPLFIKEGLKDRAPIRSMPGISQLSIKEAVKEAEAAHKKGVRSVLLFGIPKKKDAKATGAYAEKGIVQEAIRAIKAKCPDLFVMTDVCLCEYMEHGHCGLVDKKGRVLNDPSLELLARAALSHAEAGSDLVAPSDMMDGRVAAIRSALDGNGFTDLPLMSYAVKYASAFYGPFREAAESAPQFGDRKTYQMDPANRREAIKEALLDANEGADILMVKPAMAYLDILAELRDKINLPLAAYQVSGEYSMIVAASDKGWLDRKSMILESLTAIKRAGAQLIITYFAKEIIESL